MQHTCIKGKCGQKDKTFCRENVLSGRFKEVEQAEQEEKGEGEHCRS